MKNEPGIFVLFDVTRNSLSQLSLLIGNTMRTETELMNLHKEQGLDVTMTVEEPDSCGNCYGAAPEGHCCQTW
jgi:hypothetical protein